MTTIRNLIIVLVIAMAAVPASAQRQPIPEGDRGKWLSEMRNYKHEYLVKELKLTREQQNEFFPIYDEMEDEIARITNETRDLERSVTENTEASNTEIEAAARAAFEQKQREGEVEISYFDKFKKVLTPQQLLQLKSVERRFTQHLVDHHRRMVRGDRGAKKK